jgi:hypothetical protein
MSESPEAAESLGTQPGDVEWWDHYTAEAVVTERLERRPIGLTPGERDAAGEALRAFRGRNCIGGLDRSKAAVDAIIDAINAHAARKEASSPRSPRPAAAGARCE